jgi:hypothetical protein
MTPRWVRREDWARGLLAGRDLALTAGVDLQRPDRATAWGFGLGKSPGSSSAFVGIRNILKGLAGRR